MKKFTAYFILTVFVSLISLSLGLVAPWTTSTTPLLVAFIYGVAQIAVVALIVGLLFWAVRELVN